MRPFQLIVSCSENRVIGRGGKLPWSIPEDFAFFRRQTVGQVVVLGRVCFETWPGAVEEGRRAVVVTSLPHGLPRTPAGAASDFPSALAAAEQLPGDLYICGGERIYREAIVHPSARLLYLTLVHAEVDGDTRFPDWRSAFPREIARRESADAKWRYTFLTLGR